MKQVTIIRHAQSKFNAGQFNTEEEIRNCRITDHGKQQAGLLGNDFDLLIISPLKRAIETYVNSNIKTNKIMICDLFREQKDGRPLNFLENEEVTKENTEQVKERAKLAVEYIKNLEYKDIGIISHGIFMCYFLEQCGVNKCSVYNCESITITI